VEAPAVEYKELSSTERAEHSSVIRERVIAARKTQKERSFESRKCHAKTEMSHHILKTHCRLDAAVQELLRHAMKELHLSARAYDRILRVSRTIADLAESTAIHPEHVAEAIQYRTLDRNLWR